MAGRERPEGAQERPGASPAAMDEGDAAPPGTAAGDEKERRAARRDPGDAVPPGVAPLEPPEPTEEDRRVLDKLRDLPRPG